MARADDKARDLIRAVRPIGNTASLSDKVVDLLRQWIDAGDLRPGDKLPTEQELTRATGVSRAVVREAIARLKSDGIVTSRQGVGAFVAENLLRRPFRIDPDTLATPRDIVNVMELRLSVETEAAALAARNAGKADLRRLDAAHQRFADLCRAAQPAIEQDFDFHCAVADATGNPLIGDFLRFLGPFIIPRPMLRFAPQAGAARAGYLDQLLREHVAVRDAIHAGDPEAARGAMRVHLSRGIELNRTEPQSHDTAGDGA